jgi:tryptophan synthase alpha subunit
VAAAGADGVIVGSALVREAEGETNVLVARVTERARALRGEPDRGP